MTRKAAEFLHPMLAVLMLAPGLGITSAPIAAEGPGLARLEPQTGLYIGVVLGRETSRGKHIKELGFKPAVVGKFFAMQGNLSENGELRSFLLECRRHGAIALLTLMPEDGLDKVDERRCHELAELCAREEKAGARGIMLRFAHEMNGDWYRWGMQPGLYKRKFRMLSAVIHRTTTRTAMVWAPTECRGYPFKRHPYSLELDTDRDGKITAADDQYMPFFPGDDSVDWVGLTFYHWGVKYPWGKNLMPEPNEACRTIYGAGSGFDFYRTFCLEHQKPMMIAETSAFFNLDAPPGPGELAIKREWIRQVFALSSRKGTRDDADQHQKLKCINWFDTCKREEEVHGNLIDWRISHNRSVRSAFLNALGKNKTAIWQAGDFMIDAKGRWHRNLRRP